MITDVKQAFRGLKRRPGFSLLGAATLAVGISASVIVFTLAEAVLIRGLPLPDSQELVRIYSSNPSRGMNQFSVSFPDYQDFSSRQDLLQSFSLYQESPQDLSGEGEPERLGIANVAPGYFQVLGTTPLLGRQFASEDHSPGSVATAVLGEALWERRFGADSSVVGRTIRLDGRPYTVVGVVPSSQSWPLETDIWIPFQWGGSPPDWADRRSNHTFQVIARLQPEVQVGEASSQLREMSRAIYSGGGVDDFEAGIEALAVPLRRSAAGDETGPIFGVMGIAVFLVLLIACINASGLLLTRAWGRAREISLRSALGAGKGRLAWLVFLEGGLLAVLGCGIGLFITILGMRQATHLMPQGMPTLSDLEINGTVLLGAVGITLLSTLLAGALPALRTAGTSVAEALKEGSLQSGQGRSSQWLRRVLVVSQLGLSLALLAAAGMTVRGFQHQLETDPGFRTENLLTFAVRLPSARYGEVEQAEAYFDEALLRFSAVPGVTSATSTSRLPLGAGGMGLFRSFVFEGDPVPPEGVDYGAAWVEIDPEYLGTLGVQPQEGRGFTADDSGGGPPVALVNQTMAQRMSAGSSMVGRVIRSHHDENLPRVVVGVVGDIQFDGLAGRDEPVVFVPRAQAVRRSMAFLLRTAGDPADVIPRIRTAMVELDPDVALDRLETLEDGHRRDLAGVRFLTTLFGAFGVLALVLAISGVYGLVSFSVSQRNQEIGIRMAVGATTGQISREVLWEGFWLAGFGAILGLGLAYGFGRMLGSALFGLVDLNPMTLVAAVALLLVAAVGASWFPSLRATRVDPMYALRSE